MVAEEMKTAPGFIVPATPLGPNSTASVCAPLTTTETTMPASLAAPAGCRRATTALGDEAVHRRGRDVIADDVETCALHRPGHSEPHGAKTDDGRDNGRGRVFSKR